jgi:putative oxidoreductase
MVGGRAAGIHGERTMMAPDNSRRNYAVFAVSIAVAAVFIYAGIDKIRDPLQFADSTAAFAILPAVFINLLALGLPPFEIACGVLLLGPRTRRVGALAVAGISVVFFTALASALLRGLTLDCGCFGVGAPSRPRMWLELALDAALFSGALFIYLRSITRLSARAP